MLDHEPDTNNPTEGPTPSSAEGSEQAPARPPRRRRAASRPAGPPSTAPDAPAIEQIVVPEPVTPEPVAPEPVAPEPVAAELLVAVDEALPVKKPARKAAAKRPAKKAAAAPDQALLPENATEPTAEAEAPADAAPAVDAARARTRAPRKRAPRKVAVAEETPAPEALAAEAPTEVAAEAPAPVQEPVDSELAAVPEPELSALDESPLDVLEETEAGEDGQTETVPAPEPAAPNYAISFSAGPLSPDDLRTDALKTKAPEVVPVEDEAEDDQDADDEASDQADDEGPEDENAEEENADDGSEREGGDGRRRRRRRGGRRRRRTGGDEDRGDTGDEPAAEDPAAAEATAPADAAPEAAEGTESGAADDESGSDEGENESDGSRRRRRRRRRRGEDSASAPDDPTEVVVRVREPRRNTKSASTGSDSSGVTGIEGSTRMEAKRQRRRDGREAGRRRAPILSEAEFLARRESVSRKMIIRQADDLSQIAVIEDDILVEHYVDRDSAASLIGNVYLGRVQNVLPSMEAAFIDIGRGRNAVLYAGEVDWDSFGAEGQGRKVERVLKSGQTILVQVTKDPVGAKGARLTNHVSIPGRYIVYAPSGHLSGISRKLPDTERKRLKDILSDLIGEASVIVRTAAEGASEDELVRDVNRLKAQWADIEKKVKAGQSPQLLYGEPDLTVRIVRDLFTEDFSELIIQGNGAANDAYEAVEAYVTHVAPHLADRLRGWNPDERGDLFAEYRLDEQIAKGLERKVFLPSGGSLVIDRTEAMTVIDVNTGKFTGSGGNLEATVTSNNLEAAEEIVNQLRLRDVGGIIVIDFIDMVLPANRELLLRRLVECLGRDRTRHQVAEVTSLGLVQMTRKKIGTGLAEAFTTECPHCHGRGVEIHDLPVESQRQADGGARDGGRGGNRRGGSNGGGSNGGGSNSGGGHGAPTPAPRAPMPPELRPHPEPVLRPEPEQQAEPEQQVEPEQHVEHQPEPQREVRVELESQPEVHVVPEPQPEVRVETTGDGVEAVGPEREPVVEEAPASPPARRSGTRRRAVRPQGAPTAADPQAAPASDPQGEPVPAS